MIMGKYGKYDGTCQQKTDVVTMGVSSAIPRDDFVIFGVFMTGYNIFPRPCETPQKRIDKWHHIEIVIIIMMFLPFLGNTTRKRWVSRLQNIVKLAQGMGIQHLWLFVRIMNWYGSILWSWFISTHQDGWFKTVVKIWATKTQSSCWILEKHMLWGC